MRMQNALLFYNNIKVLVKEYMYTSSKTIFRTRFLTKGYASFPHENTSNSVYSVFFKKALSSNKLRIIIILKKTIS